jgi:hypothetical protein
MKLSMFYFAPIFALVMLLEGCVDWTEVKGYDGPPLAIEKLAFIDTHPWGCIGCLRGLVRVEDGRRERILPLDASVLEEYRDASVLEEYRRDSLGFKKEVGGIMLLPGEYQISGSFTGLKANTVNLTVTATLEAGHEYRFVGEWCSGLISIYKCRGYTSNIYFLDRTTGEVIAGKKWSTYLG